MTDQHTSPYILCVRNDSYPASLELRKVYRSMPDLTAAARNFVRVVDESGDDYLYPADCFVPINLPQAALGAFVEVS